MAEKICAMLMRVGPRFPGLLDDSEGSFKHMTAQYQCLQTVSPVGPDHNIASPRECTEARNCYRPA